MAEITKSILGQVSGQLDNLVFRKLNGKSFVSVRPKKYKASKSPTAVEGRNNFAVTVKLAKSVNAVLVLKEIWTVSKTEGTNSFQKIIKNNAKLVKEGSLTISNKITPVGSSLKLTSASIENKILHLTFVCFANPNLKFPAVLFIYFYFEKEGKAVLPVSVLIEAPSPDGLYDMDIALDSQIKKILTRDPDPIIFAAIAGGTPYKKKIYWTSTASVQID